MKMANEKRRLIDANDAVKLLRGKCVAKYPNSFLLGLLAAATEIEQSPTVDAVEVVRCKDCKYCRLASWGERYCNRDKFVEWGDLKEDDFCSYGERRKDDGV